MSRTLQHLGSNLGAPAAFKSAGSQGNVQSGGGPGEDAQGDFTAKGSQATTQIRVEVPPVAVSVPAENRTLAQIGTPVQFGRTE